MNYESLMKEVETVHDSKCVGPDRASAGAEADRGPENLKTMLDTANCIATEIEVLAEQLHHFLFGTTNCVDRINQKDPGCFLDALQNQIELCANVNGLLREIYVLLGV